MEPETFEAFVDQLDRYVRERLIPAESEVIETDAVPPAILDEMRELGLFGITIPESHGGAGMNVSQYVLNGTKRYITNAPMAKVALIMARTSAENLPRNAHVSAFILPTDTPGLTIGKADRKMGQSGAQIADIILENVNVGEDALLGGVEGKGFEHAMRSLDNGRLSVAAAATGYAKRALDTALAYAVERKAFGEPIASFQLIQAMLADSRAEIYAAECMIADACRLADEGVRTTIEASATKMFASEMCGRVVDRCVQIFGGAGYLQEYPAERFYRDARLYRIYEGTTQILQLLIARTMLKDFAAHV
jgi:acyl-CoA dehydrogenase